MIKIGDKVKWESAAGTLFGKVCDIFIHYNSAGNLIPWISIEYTVWGNKLDRCNLAGSEDNIKMMKLEVI